MASQVIAADDDAAQRHQVTGGKVASAYVDQGDTGPAAAEAAGQSSITLQIVQHQAAKRGFVLLPQRWVGERTFGWVSRFRRLAREYERLSIILAGWPSSPCCSVKSFSKVHNRR
jgi:transposase